MTEDTNEFAELKDLLDAWNVSELFEHFQAEDINIEELQIMKFHHIEFALQLFRLGTRIRFEHHLQQWRQSLNKPLHITPMNTFGAHCPCKCAAQTLPNSPDVTVNPTAIHADIQISRSETSSDIPPEPLVAVTEIDLEQVAPQINDNDYNMLQSITNEMLSPELPKFSPNVNDQFKQEYSSFSAVSVNYILNNSGPSGLNLLNYRSEHKPLSTAQRTLLIQLIVSYFEDNQIHLSLHKSHMLEREILKLFPYEELHEYRTERRGKIYTKFVNRYKKPTKRRKYEWILKQQNASIHKSDCQIVCDEPSVKLTNWEETLLRRQIKIEDNFDQHF